MRRIVDTAYGADADGNRGIHFPNGNSLSYHKGTDFYCSEFETKEQKHNG